MTNFTATSLKEVIETIGTDKNYMLFIDNAINLYNDHRNGHIIIDEEHDLIHYFANLGNTLPETYVTLDGEKKTRSAEYICTYPALVFYVGAKLDPDELEDVLTKLVQNGSITAEDKQSVLNDKVVTGQRSHDSDISAPRLLKVGPDGLVEND